MMLEGALARYIWAKTGSKRILSHVLHTHLQLNMVLKGSLKRMSVRIIRGSSERELWPGVSTSAPRCCSS